MLALNLNRLTSIMPGMFAGLSSLTSLYLADNRITLIDEGAFDRLSSLQLLSLRSNQVDSIAAWMLSGLSLLQELDVGENRISFIEVGAFQERPTLKLLVLDSNQLTSIAAGTFSGLSSLQVLALNSNQLASIERGAFQDSLTLKSLWLQFNELKSIGAGVFSGLPFLDELYVYSNEIASIEPGAFQGLSRLRILAFGGCYNDRNGDLTCGGNRLTAIEADMFKGIPSLAELYPLNRISPLRHTFVDMPALQQLYIFSNHITSINTGLSMGSPICRCLLGMRHAVGNNYLWRNTTSIEAGVFNGLLSLRALASRTIAFLRCDWCFGLPAAVLVLSGIHQDLAADVFKSLSFQLDLSA